MAYECRCSRHPLGGNDDANQPLDRIGTVTFKRLRFARNAYLYIWILVFLGLQGVVPSLV